MSKEESTKPYLYFEQIMNGIVSIPESVQNKLQNVMLVRQQELTKEKEEEPSWFSSDKEEEEEEEKPSTSWFSFDKETSWFGSKEDKEEPSSSWFGSKEEPPAVAAPPSDAAPAVPLPIKNTNCDIRGWSK